MSRNNASNSELGIRGTLLSVDGCCSGTSTGDVDNAMIMLSTYVGHARVTDTYWYLTGIPELMAIAAQRFEHFTEGVCHV